MNRLEILILRLLLELDTEVQLTSGEREALSIQEMKAYNLSQEPTEEELNRMERMIEEDLSKVTQSFVAKLNA